MNKIGTVDLTLILPLYNEGSALSANLNYIVETLQCKSTLSFELLLIDDGSGDTTAQNARQFAQSHSTLCEFIQHTHNIGRGAIVAEGLRRARGTVTGFIDVDCEASPLYILDFVPDILMNKVDIITGVRIYPFAVSTLLRATMSVTYRMLVKNMTGSQFTDTRAGYKFFRTEAILPLLRYCKHPGWFWDTEVLVVSSLAGLRVQQRPILFFRDTSKKSTVRLAHDTTVLVRDLLVFRQQLPSIREQIKRHG
ncbi:MAG: glycosyltransferase [Parcubacteria group bacterium]